MKFSDYISCILVPCSDETITMISVLYSVNVFSLNLIALFIAF